MSKKKSRVWTFFDDIEGESSKVKCNQCQGIISRGGQGRKANTTSMTNHIKYKHSELMPQLASSIKSSSNEPHSSVASVSQLEPLPPSPNPSTSSGSEIAKQQSIRESLTVQWSLQDSRSREISVAIGEMIALDNQPLSLVENTGFINLMKKLKPKYVLPREWKLLEKCLTLLKPFEEVTKIISSSCSSISEVIPHLKTLQKYLENYVDDDQDEQLIEMKTVLENGLKTRFQNLELNKLFSLATLLDPRYKLQFFNTEHLVTVRSQFLMEALKNSLGDDDDSDLSNDERNTDNTGSSEMTVHRNFWGVYQEMVTRKVHNIDDEKSSSAHELHSYCALPVMKRNEDPFTWWHQNSSRYPEMSRIAKIYLCCPASTVYSERLFSEAGNIYETKRNRLLPDRAETLTFLHHNLPLIKNKNI
ncbi:zinc finger BED domain-containing protein 4-like [Ostrinia furnacalis]|uniref:zinc finger BED domain-containing protein 4-like n=1 Tax=Ostrinia furnacalis TaxID=93504 RepID=UPI00103F3A58|nr:zinc finger BED domain-containing protein 4-like [Ostrinia furnacalis]